MQSSDRAVIVSGSSLTDTTAWPTWATWVDFRYQPAQLINCGTKGIGNELIILKTIQEAKKHTNPLLIVQLTNVDKWDWYVEDRNLAQLISQEKHPLVKLSPTDQQGFWSTGSHFPLWKEYYRDNYFSMEYHAYRTLQLISWFQLVCQQQQWDYHILFDSPILSVTESYLNTGQLTTEECFSTRLIDNTISKVLFDLLDPSSIYWPGIIGYAHLNGHPWFTQKNKCHPGSLVHWHYTVEVLCPVLDHVLEPRQDLQLAETEARVYQRLFGKV